MASPNMDINQEHGSFSRHLHTPANENASGPVDRNNRDGTSSEVKKTNVSADVLDADSISMIANSTFSGYAPSSIETRGLLTNGRRMSSTRQRQKSVSRNAFVGVCNAVNVIIPMDIDEEVTSMQGSSVVKLAKTVKRKVAHHGVQEVRSGSSI